MLRGSSDKDCSKTAILKEVFRYNELKHQKSSIDQFIATFKSSHSELISIIKTLGESQMDLYLGPLTTHKIYAEIAGQLNKNKCFDEVNFKRWIAEGKGFQLLNLSDNSEWVLRVGEDQRYIHIHPARYSANTIRVKANLLKTVITARAVRGMGKTSIHDINQLRTQILGLSPIRVSDQHNSLKRLSELFKLSF